MQVSVIFTDGKEDECQLSSGSVVSLEFSQLREQTGYHDWSAVGMLGADKGISFYSKFLVTFRFCRLLNSTL